MAWHGMARHRGNMSHHLECHNFQKGKENRRPKKQNTTQNKERAKKKKNTTTIKPFKGRVVASDPVGI